MGAFNSIPVVGADTVTDTATVYDNYSNSLGEAPIDAIDLLNQSKRTETRSVDSKYADRHRTTTLTG